MNRTKRKVYTALLPPTACTEEMRSSMVSVADQQGISLGELQRAAFQNFLDQNYSNAKADHSIPNNTSADVKGGDEQQ